jgi:hypothetical protein
MSQPDSLGSVAPVKLKAALSASIGVMPSEVIVMPTHGLNIGFAIICANAATSKQVEARITTTSCLQALVTILSHIGVSVTGTTFSLRLHRHRANLVSEASARHESIQTRHLHHPTNNSFLSTSASIGLALGGSVILITLVAAALDDKDATTPDSPMEGITV